MALAPHYNNLKGEKFMKNLSMEIIQLKQTERNSLKRDLNNLLIDILKESDNFEYVGLGADGLILQEKTFGQLITIDTVIKNLDRFDYVDNIIEYEEKEEKRIAREKERAEKRAKREQEKKEKKNKNTK